MKVTCSGCGARHWLADMNVAGGACRIVCPNCSNTSYVDASMIEPQVLEARWHLAVNGETVGPVSAHDIEQYYQNGQVTMDSLLWCDGMSDWAQLAAVAEFDYLHSPIAGEAADMMGGDETRVGVAPTGFEGCGEETAAIDINELNVNANGAQGGIIGMGGGGEDEFSFDMGTPQQAPAPRAGSGFDNANDLVGARSENSVLFSLSSLQAVSGPSSAPSSGGGFGASSNDGLIDVKALANAAPNMGKRRKSFEASTTDFSSLGMANRSSIEFGNKKDNTLLIVLISVGGVILIGLLVALIFAMKSSTVPQQQVNANIEVEAQQAHAGGLGVEDEAAKKAKEEEAAAAKAKAEEEAAAKAKAEEEAAAKAKAEEEAAAKAKAEEEAAAKAKAEEEAAAAKAEEAKKAETKKTETKKTETKKTETKKTETKKTETKKTETKKAESKPAAGGATLTKEQVQSVIRSSFANVRTCSRTSATKGTMKVSFTIKADGRVSGAKCVSPEFNGSPAASCVVKVVNGLKFPASSKDTPVTYPFQIQ